MPWFRALTSTFDQVDGLGPVTLGQVERQAEFYDPVDSHPLAILRIALDDVTDPDRVVGDRLDERDGVVVRLQGPGNRPEPGDVGAEEGRALGGDVVPGGDPDLSGHQASPSMASM